MFDLGTGPESVSMRHMADISDFESVADRQIREAMERGEFDDLPGTGEPLPDAGAQYDPAWWAKKWIERDRERQRLAEARVDEDAAQD